jgi:hypothetical protein
MLVILAILWFVVWLFVVIDMIFRREMRAWAKVLWAIGLLVFPVVGALVYLFVRPWGPTNVTADARAAELDPYDLVRDRRPV